MGSRNAATCPNCACRPLSNWSLRTVGPARPATSAAANGVGGEFFLDQAAGPFAFFCLDLLRQQVQPTVESFFLADGQKLAGKGARQRLLAAPLPDDRLGGPAGSTKILTLAPIARCEAQRRSRPIRPAVKGFPHVTRQS